MWPAGSMLCERRPRRSFTEFYRDINLNFGKFYLASVSLIFHGRWRGWRCIHHITIVDTYQVFFPVPITNLQPHVLAAARKPIDSFWSKWHNKLPHTIYGHNDHQPPLNSHSDFIYFGSRSITVLLWSIEILLNINIKILRGRSNTYI